MSINGKLVRQDINSTFKAGAMERVCVADSYEYMFDEAQTNNSS